MKFANEKAITIKWGSSITILSNQHFYAGMHKNEKKNLKNLFRKEHKSKSTCECLL